MPRYPYFLSRGKGKAQPARIVGLAADSSDVPVPGDSALLRESLTGWHACGYGRGSKANDVRWANSGKDALSFWGAIDYALKRGGITWVASWGATRVWGLLNLWEAMEDGRVTVGGSHGDASPTDKGTDDESQGCVGESGAGHGQPGKGGGRRSEQALLCLEDPPTVIKFRRPGLPGTVLIVDMENWGIECPCPDAPADRQAWLALETMLAMVATLTEEGWGSLRATSGAQAWSVWRYAYPDQTVYIHCDPEALALEDEAYIGGRCECRFIGVYPGPVYHVDFRSIYASVCACDELPSLLATVGSQPATQGLLRGTGNALRIAAVTLRSEEQAYPRRKAERVHYPTGTWRAVLAEPELRDAEQRGRVVKYGKVAYYRANPCARSYALAVWKRLCRARDEEDALLAQWLKRLLVALPGKFGARGYHWKEGEPGPCDPIWGQWWRPRRTGGMEHCRGVAGVTEVEIEEDWAPEACPAMAAYITSAARVHLLNAIRQAGWQNVLYYDTDSLIVTEEGFQYLWCGGMVKPNDLGRLRLMGRHEHCEIIGIKHYVLDGARTCAGSPKRLVRPCSVPGYHWEWQTTRDAIWQGHRPIVEAILRKYARDEAYAYGVVGPDGWVLPHHVNEGG